VPLTLVTGPANSAKAQVVLDGYRAALARSPILVVPRAADADHYRRELADSGATFGVRVEPFSVLMREIAQRAGVAERPLGEYARAAVLTAVINGANLQALATGAQAPTFVDSLTRFIGQLESRRVSPARFTAALRTWAPEGTSRRVYAEELAGLYGGYRRRLERLGRLDNELHQVAALDALALAPERWGRTPVFCYGFDDLEPLQRDAIETLAHKVDAAVTLSLPGEPGRVAFAGRASTLETLLPGAQPLIKLEADPDYYDDPALFHLERSLFEDSPPIAPGVAVALLEGGDERAEAELVGAEVAKLIAEGFAPGEIAIVTRSAGAPGALIGEVLDTLEVRHTESRRDPLDSSSVGRGLLAMLRCIAPGAQAADLVSWLRVPGVVRLQSAVDALESRLLRKAITGFDPAREIWEREHGRLRVIAGLSQAQRSGGLALLDYVEGELDQLFAAPHQRTAALLDPWEAAAVLAARRALRELREVVRSEEHLLGGVSGLLRALGSVTVELAASSDGSAVLISDALSLRARRVQALLICAVQEGTFPAPGREELFLGSAERAELAQQTGLVLSTPADALDAERYLFYALCSRPSARLRVSWHVATGDGDAALASLFIEDLRDCFEPRLYDERALRDAGAIAWGGAAPVARLRQIDRLLSEPRRRGATIAPLKMPERIGALRRSASHSASSLERWTKCPVAWFVERGLRPDELTPEQLWPARGVAAHAVLADVFSGLVERSPGGQLTPATLPLAIELLEAALAAQARMLSPSAEIDAAERHRLRADLERYLEFAADAQSTHHPWEVELAFGMDDSPYPAVELAGGALSLRGSIDRVDLDRAGATVVIHDYKTGGGVTPQARWAEEHRLQPALYMRAVEQLFDVEAVGGLYQPLRQAELRPRGALRRDADPDLGLADKDRISAEELTALVDGQIAVALQAAQEIDLGTIEPRPATCTANRGCLYPTICRCEAR
jgi:ATP-dependent helicase/DNAse subunit B